MRKLLVGVTVVALSGLLAVPATGDTEPVGFGVATYMEVSWGTPTSTTLTLLPPGESTKNGNWFAIPLTVESNCNVTVTIYEGMTQFLLSQGIPGSAIWSGTSPYPPFCPGCHLGSEATEPSIVTGPDFDWCGSNDLRGNLPDGSGLGLYATMDINHGTTFTGPHGTSYNYSDGQLTTWCTFELNTMSSQIDGFRWTSLSSGTTGTFNIYAVVSAL